MITKHDAHSEPEVFHTAKSDDEEIQSNKNLIAAVEKGDSRQMSLILKQYRTPSGAVDFPNVLSVPTAERLPSLVSRDFMYATGLVVAALALALEKLTLKKKIDGVLVNNIADEIINTCEEDNLSLEDLMLFLQGLVRGQYGDISELSLTKFMRLFDAYRDERHEALMLYRENEHLQYKGMGDAGRSVREDPLADHFSKLGASLHELRMQLSEQKKEANVLKQAKKFYGE